MIEPELATLIDSGIERIFATMRHHAPIMADKTCRWAETLAGTGTPADYFKQIRGFPFLLIPWWVEKSLGRNPDPALQADLVYSSMNGYYFIRMMDNIMDGHATVEPQILPAAAFFHTESVGVFNPLFPADHPFWEAFRQTWYGSAEITVQDRLLDDKDEAAFRSIVSRKVGAAKIPLLAICHLRQRPDLIGAWSHFIDQFGMWHLFEEDLFDWHTDLLNQTRTHFLCEADRRKRPGESIEAWALREGVQWGVDTLHRWMPEADQAAGSLNSPDAVAYLSTRADHLDRRVEKLTSGMKALSSLLAEGN